MTDDIPAKQPAGERSTTAPPRSTAAAPARFPQELPDGPAEALCAQVDPEAFFPPKGSASAAAKAICGRCELLDPCRQYALTARVTGGYPVSGIWGGTSEADRTRLRRAAAAAAVDELVVDLVDLVDHDVASDVA